MNEFIEKLIGRLEEEKEYCSYNPKIRDEAINKAIEIVNQLAEEYNGGWIPVSEGLPKQAFGCLVTVMDCEPTTGTDFENILPYHVGYDGETWNDADGNVIPFEVIAWQPLPAPYQPKGE